MRKLLRHLAYLLILIGLLAIAGWMAPDYALVSGWPRIEPIVIPRISTPFAYQLLYVAWLTMPLAFAVVIWGTVRLLFKKRPCVDSERGGIA